MVRLVLFDIDGTLINSGGAGEKAFGQVFSSLFQVANGTERLQFAGRTDRAIVREFFLWNKIEPNGHNFSRFFDAYVFWLDHMLGQLPGRVLPGVPELLAELESLSPVPMIGLLTGNVRLGAQIKLSHYRLWHRFEIGGFGDDSEDRCEIASIAMQRGEKILGRKLHGDEVLVIGDTPLDIACARSINARILAVATGRYATRELQKDAPHWAVDDLTKITARDLCR
jgi:phosphoglycolate phosphatase-like HAD superfamily hydrolase